MGQATQILCVDDERNVLRSLERIFLDDDYQILTASSGQEGLQVLEENPLVQVVISDYRMPVMSGVEFLKEVCRRRPDTIRIVLSGYADTSAVVSAINEGNIYKFIPKPWNDEELRLTVAKAIETFDICRLNEKLTEDLRLKNAQLVELNERLEHEVQRRTEELSLQNSALTFAWKVLDHLPTGVLAVTREGTLVQLNRIMAGLLKKDAKDVIGAPVETFLPPDLCALLREGSSPHCVHQLEVEGAKVRVTVAAFEAEGVILTVCPMARHDEGAQA